MFPLSLLLVLFLGVILFLYVGFNEASLPNPRIIKHPEDRYIAKNKPASLHCEAEGSPEPNITWYQNGKRALTNKDDPSYTRMIIDKGVDKGRLFFLSVTNDGDRSDVGTYYCNASNVHGNAISKMAHLRLAVLRSDFRFVPYNTTVAVGATATVYCSPPRGEPEPKVKWQKNGLDLPHSTRFTIDSTGNLIMEKVEKEDRGNYRCVAVNEAGTRMSPAARLSVLERPVITQMPESVVVDVGDEVNLHCLAIGDPPPTVSWVKDEGSINYERVRELPDNTLQIVDVQASDAGEYICSADNAVGSTQAVARVSVHALPLVRIDPKEQVTGIGHQVALHCIASGNPEPSVYWSKGNKEVLMFPNQDHGRFSVRSNGMLMIEDVEFQDDGIYTCHAVNAVGSTDKSATVRVRVDMDLPVIEVDTRPPPIISVGPQNQTFQAKGLAMLPCEAKGSPPPRIQWFRNGRPLPLTDNRILNLGSGTLQITDLKTTDAGIYTCKAVSATGETSWNAEINIETNTGHRTPVVRSKDLPGPPSKPEVTDVSDTSISLKWKAHIDEGSSKLESFVVEYFSPGLTPSWVKVPDHITTESYRVENLEPQTDYKFMVRGKNRHGIGVPSPMSKYVRTKKKMVQPVIQQPKAKPKLRVPSAPPENIVIHKETETSISIRWSPPPIHHRKDAIARYDIFCSDNNNKLNCSKSVNGTEHNTVIVGLNKDETYTIRIAARTKDGLGVWSKDYVIGPEQTDIMKEPWFIGMLIGTVGGTLWLALCLFTVLLCRRRTTRKKLKQNGMYNAPVEKANDHLRNGNLFPYHDGFNSTHKGDMSESSGNCCYSDHDNCTNEVIYNTIEPSAPEMSTFYQRSNNPNSVGLYATTTLIGSNAAQMSRNQTGDKNMCTVNQGYMHHDSSGYSGKAKHAMDDCDKHAGYRQVTGYKQPSVNMDGFFPPPPSYPPGEISSDSPRSSYFDERQLTKSPMSPNSRIPMCSGHYQHGHRVMPAQQMIQTGDMENRSDSPRNVCVAGHQHSHGHYCQPHPQNSHHDPRNSTPRTCSCSNFLYHPPQTSPHPNPCDTHTFPSRGCMSDTHSPLDCKGGGTLPHKSCKNDFSGLPQTTYSNCDTQDSSDCDLGKSINQSCQGCNPYSSSKGDKSCQSPFPVLANTCCPPGLSAKLSMGESGPHLEIDNYGRSADSFLSEENADYAAESDLDATRDSSLIITDQSNTSSPRSSLIASSDGSFLDEADFTSAIAKAAEMSGLTVIGTTVQENKTGKKLKKSHERNRAHRPPSPYSTDSNVSGTTRKQHPRSQRRKLTDHGKKESLTNGQVEKLETLKSESASPSSPGDQVVFKRPSYPKVTIPSSVYNTGKSGTTFNPAAVPLLSSNAVELSDSIT